MLYFRLLTISIILTLISSCNGQNLTQTPSPPSKNETNAPGRIVSEMDDCIFNIFQDKNNNYWFGSKDHGVYKYDGNSLIQFTVEDGLYDNRIRGIQEDKSGNIYFDTGEGINKYDGLTIEKLILSQDQNKVWKLESEDLWFAGNWNKNGPYRYDGSQLYHLKFPKHELEAEVHATNPNATFSPYEVYIIQKDSKGNIWFGTSVLGACRFDGKSLSWVSEREMTEIDPGPAAGVRSILEDKEGNFWFSSNVNHKYKIFQDHSTSDQDEMKYKQLPGIETSKESDLNNYFMAITQDDHGDIWMARYDGGVWKYDGKKLSHYPIKDRNKDVMIFTIYKDKLGDLWLGTHNAGVLKFNGKTFERFHPKTNK